MVSVEELPAVTELGLNDAVAPAGRPLAVSVTVSADPLRTLVFTVVVTELPGFVEPEEGDVPMVKSLEGAEKFGFTTKRPPSMVKTATLPLG